jgi:hypothetical protein
VSVSCLQSDHLIRSEQRLSLWTCSTMAAQSEAANDEWEDDGDWEDAPTGATPNMCVSCLFFGGSWIFVSKICQTKVLSLSLGSLNSLVFFSITCVCPHLQTLLVFPTLKLLQASEHPVARLLGVPHLLGATWTVQGDLPVG